MEKSKQKSRKEKPNKYMDKEKSSSFIADVKTLKENLKIREILRTVKMNSSMRIKAPRGSRVMQNKDFNENEELFEDTINVENENEDPPSAINTILNTEVDNVAFAKENFENDETNSQGNIVSTEFNENENGNDDTSVIHETKTFSEDLKGCAVNDGNASDSLITLAPPTVSSGIKTRERKLSLDHSMLSKRESLSQSEIDLHSIGKSPLERKSSFFKKKMDSFLKNTTEIFKRQSLGGHSIPSPTVRRRDSTCSRMSVSLQSLNENSVYNGDNDIPIEKCHDQQESVINLSSLAMPDGSNFSISVNLCDGPPNMSEEESLAGSQQELVGSQPLPDACSSIHGSNDSFMQESFWNTRAISMSSGLDTATGQRRRKASKSNRVSWLASESLTDYFRRLIQDEKYQESQENSQDFSSIPENNKLKPKIDSKGRRLSYVRAVSGEDPILPSKSQESSLKKKKNPENEGYFKQEIEVLLSMFSQHGAPNLKGFTPRTMKHKPKILLGLLDSETSILEYFNWRTASAIEEQKRSVLRELITTEAIYLRHLKDIVEVYIATAHGLQSKGAMSHIKTNVLFLNIPDIFNTNLKFWENVIYPLIQDGKKNGTFNPSLMIPGFMEFADFFAPYEEYMHHYRQAIDYLRTLHLEPNFLTYLAWCHQQAKTRLQLEDMLVKPMQRLTKYTLLINRLTAAETDVAKKQELELAESRVKGFLVNVNRSCRQKDEFDILLDLKIEPYEPDFKGDLEVEIAYKSVSTLDLLQPMIDCAPHIIRCLIHQGDLHFKDSQKEFDAHIMLFTDMMLICKKQSKTTKSANLWKLHRPKILLHRVVPQTKPARSAHEASSLILLILDEQGFSQGFFHLTETAKDPNPTQTIRVWESKISEATMSYELTKWYSRYPVTNISVVEKDYNEDSFKRENPDICAVEKKARSRVAATLLPNKLLKLPDTSRDLEIPLTALDLEKGPTHLHSICAHGLYNYNARQAYLVTLRNQATGSNEDSNETPAKLQRSGSSKEQYVLPQFDDLHRFSFENTGPRAASARQASGPLQYKFVKPHQPPTLVFQKSSPNHSPGPRSASAGSNGNMLRVMLPPHATVHSLPDINAELEEVPQLEIAAQTASEKLYKSHQELVQRNRLAASQQLLCPDQRGSSYPPPSPTRPLLRGLAFNYPSFKSKPPLTRSKNVISPKNDTQKISDLIPLRILGKKSPQPQRADPKQRSPSPSTSACPGDLNVASTSVDESNKKTPTSSGDQNESPTCVVNAETVRCVEPERAQGEQSTDSDYEADDDLSKRSNQSHKNMKVKHKKKPYKFDVQDVSTSDEDQHIFSVSSNEPANENQNKDG